MVDYSIEAEALEISRQYEAGWRSFRYRASDGVALAGRDYGDPDGSSLPVLCLPGLTRNGKDFHTLAVALSQSRERPRRVLTLDFRGRGDSEFDADTSRYTPAVELQDVLATLPEAGLGRVAVVGTSRGGLVGMLMAASAPETVAALILNDIGPVVETAGLARIAGYVVSPREPADWAEAAEFVKSVNQDQFPQLTDTEWLRFAVQIYRNRDGRPAVDFDPGLGVSFAAVDLTQPVPTLWDVYDGLAATPILALRGANSDILSTATLTDMASRHPRTQTFVVPDQGHAPLLWDTRTITHIGRYIDEIEAMAAPISLPPLNI